MTLSETMFVLGLLFVVLFIYWSLWQLYLLVSSRFLTGFDFWKKTPEFIRRPKFWQFILFIFAYNYVSGKFKNKL